MSTENTTQEEVLEENEQEELVEAPEQDEQTEQPETVLAEKAKVKEDDNEEDDFCRRARRHGSKVVYFPKTTIIHLRGKTTHLPEIRGRVIIETYLSNLYFYSKHYSLGWNVVLRILYRITFVLGLLTSALRHLTGKSSQGQDDSLRLKLKLLFLNTPPLKTR